MSQGRKKMLEDCEQILVFLFLLGLVENNCWEYNHKPFKKNNWKAFTNVVNENFPNDVK
jgi:hypothetical protein